MQQLQPSWLLKMAWRDSRRNRSRLLLFISSIILGIAALVAINSFSENLQKDINKEAKSLLGADLVLESEVAPSTNALAFMDSLSEHQAKIVDFASMVAFPKGGFTRLANIKAVEGAFPFYGKLTTLPTDAAASYQKGKTALVDKTMMIQFDAKVGDTIKVGEVDFIIAGEISAAPGRSGITAAVAPSVYIPKSYLKATGLIQIGSRVDYYHYFKLPKNVNPDAFVDEHIERIKTLELHPDTVEERKRDLGEAFSSMANFLNLVGFIALLLGCIGVASSVHIYVKDKLNTVAVLRCLGASGRQAFLIYLFQILGMGILGSIAGALLGSFLQIALPAVLSDFLPLENVSTDLSYSAILAGVVTGLSIAVLFALLPLLKIRKTSPLRSLRASVDSEKTKDPWRWLVYVLIALFIGGFTWFQTKDVIATIALIVSVLIAFLLLAGIARMLMFLMKRFFPTRWSFLWRQGIANLFRPNNQTLILMVTIGLGTALISTLFLTQSLLLKQVELSDSNNQPNIILFDIQSSQKDAVAKLVQQHDMPLVQEVPIVTMRLDNIDGINKAAFKKDTTSRVRSWVYNREYRVTYRDTMIETERILEGKWYGAPKNDTIYISISDRIARSMNAKIGTKLTFNVQGTLIETVVGSIRAIEFNRVQTNFFVVFPKGVLEEAPQFHVIVSRVNAVEQSAKFQQELVQNFSNVSAIDLTQILKTVDDILSKVSFVIRFMALFSILTGLLVLISSVVLSKYQRIQESVLLRTLGAKSKQIRYITAIEYSLLGFLAAFTGVGLSIVGSWALARFSFDIPYETNFLPSISILFIITILTVFIGLFNSRDVLRKPPLEVLRKEV